MEQQRESTNYRHSTCTVAAAIADKLQQSKHGENYSVKVQGKRKPLSPKKLIGTESIDSQSGSTKGKVKAYEDKPLVTTTKNFIGKSCYNVRRLVVASESLNHEDETFETNCAQREERQQNKLRVSVLVGRKGFWLQSSASGARF